MEQLLERINKAPNQLKFGVMFGVVALMTAANYFLVVEPTEQEIVILQGQQLALEKTLAEKQEIAQNLNERRKEMDELERKLLAALSELPERKDIDELLAQLNDIGKKSGLEISSVQPGPSFNTRHHRVHEEFYEKVLRLEREPEAIHERYEPWLASRPEFVADYQRRYAFHGAHALISWYQCTPMRRLASRIIVAHGDPRACSRLGFMAAPNFEAALRKAKESVANAEPVVRVLELPPAFFTRVE